jgi:hypothetical protein
VLPEETVRGAAPPRPGTTIAGTLPAQISRSEWRPMRSSATISSMSVPGRRTHRRIRIADETLTALLGRAGATVVESLDYASLA